MTDIFKQNLLTKDFSAILGAESTKTQLKSALLTSRHIILVGPPGVGKTTLAKNVLDFLPERDAIPQEHPLAKQLNEVLDENRFIRVQGSADLTAEDLLGDIDPMKAMEFGPLSLEAFTPGKIFKAHQGILFFDEINRCSEKLQNALLQVLEEKKITIGSYAIDFDTDFIFIGTMNPDDTSTEPLSDVFLDRFDLIAVEYPDTREIEKDIVKSKGQNLLPVSEELLDYIIRFVRNLRHHEHIEKKPSVRASIGVFERAQSHALLKKREQVLLEDIAAVMTSVMAHRIKLKPSVKFLETPEAFVQEEFRKFTEKEGDVP